MARIDITNSLDDNDLNAHQNNYKELYTGMSNAQAAKVILDNFLTGTGVVTSKMLSSNSVTKIKMADNSVGTAQIENLAVDGSKLANGSVSGNKISEGGVGTRHLLTDTVSTPKIQDSAVTSAKIANRQIDSIKIGFGEVKRANIEEAAINSSRIADYSIRSNHLGGGAVGNSHIQDNVISNEKVTFDSLTINKGKLFPMQQINADNKVELLNGILDAKVQFAEIDTSYSISFVGKNSTSWGDPVTFIQIHKSKDGFLEDSQLIAGRAQTGTQDIPNGQTGINTHVVKSHVSDEIFTVTLDWDALTSENNNFRTGTTTNYIIRPSQYFFKRTPKENPTEDLGVKMAFNIDGRKIMAKEKLNDTQNIIYEYGTLTPNDFFEITYVKTQSSDSSVNDYSGETLLRSSTDWVSPYGMKVDNNPISDGSFTVGGGHGTQGGSGFATGSFIGISDVKVDGKSISNGNYIGDELTFTIEHYVSASNAIDLETGTKRDTAKETRYYRLNKNGIHVEVRLKALEPITMTHYAGLQTIQRDSFDYFYYRGDKPEKLYTVTGLTEWELPTLKDPKILDRVIMYNPEIVLVMKTDRTYGIGTGEYIPDSEIQRPMHATPNTGKIYMHNLGRSSNNYKMNTGEDIRYRGTYKFTKNTSVENTVVSYEFENENYSDNIRDYEVI